MADFLDAVAMDDTPTSRFHLALAYWKLKKPEAIEAAVTRLRADPTGSGAATADLVIEAVFEDLAIKQQVLRSSLGKIQALTQRIMDTDHPEKSRQLLDELNS